MDSSRGRPAGHRGAGRRRPRHLRGAGALAVRAGGGASLHRALRRAARAPAGRQRERPRPGRDPRPPGLPRDPQRGSIRTVLPLGQRVGDQRGRRGPRHAGRIGRAGHPAAAGRHRGPERRATPRAAGQRRRRHGREHPPGAPARRAPGPARRGPGHRGRALLRARRRGPPRHRARAVDQCPEGARRRGGQHHHPAARQESAAQPGAHARAQDQRGAAVDRARVALQQGSDPRGLPQRDLSGAIGRLGGARRRRRLARVFRQGGPSALAAGGRAARGNDPRSQQLLAGRQSRARAGAARRGPHAHARPRQDLGGRLPPRPQGAGARPHHSGERADGAVLRGLRARRARAERRHRPGRPARGARLHHARSGAAAAGRGRGGEGHGPSRDAAPAAAPARTRRSACRWR